MSQEKLYDVWWNEEAIGDQQMEDNHQRHWEKVLNHVEVKDFTDLNVLDFGCNQGGFLRALYQEHPFKNGVGVDLARKSIEVAESRKGDLPLHYYATASPEHLDMKFDVAFSISVIYLIKDLKQHAKTMKKLLANGGSYYSTFTDYRKNPSVDNMKKIIDHYGSLGMNLHTLDDIAQAFLAEGFEVGIQRLLPTGYIPISADDRWFLAADDRVHYEYEQSYIFKFTLPLS